MNFFLSLYMRATKNDVACLRSIIVGVDCLTINVRRKLEILSIKLLNENRETRGPLSEV